MTARTGKSPAENSSGERDRRACAQPGEEGAGASVRSPLFDDDPSEAIYTPDAPTRLMPAPLKDDDEDLFEDDGAPVLESAVSALSTEDDAGSALARAPTRLSAPPPASEHGPPLNDEDPPLPFERGGPTTVQPVLLSDFELVDALPLASEAHIDDPFQAQETKVDHKSFSSQEAEDVPLDSLEGASSALRSLIDDDDDEVTEHAPPLSVATDPHPPVAHADDEQTEPLKVTPPTRSRTVERALDDETATAPLYAALEDGPSAPSDDDDPDARTTPRMHIPVGHELPDPPSLVDPSLEASAEEVQLHRWRIVPTLLAELEEEQGQPKPPSPLPNPRAMQTVLWSLYEEEARRRELSEAAAEAEEEAKPAAPARPQLQTVLLKLEDEEAAPSAAAKEVPAQAGGPQTTTTRAAAVYTYDALAYLRSLHPFAAHLDEECRREFMARALGGAEKLRRALALLHAAPLDEEGGDED